MSTSEKKFECPICHRRFAAKRIMKRHLKTLQCGFDLCQCGSQTSYKHYLKKATQTIEKCDILKAVENGECTVTGRLDPLGTRSMVICHYCRNWKRCDNFLTHLNSCREYANNIKKSQDEIDAALQSGKCLNYTKAEFLQLDILKNYLFPLFTAHHAGDNVSQRIDDKYDLLIQNAAQSRNKTKSNNSSKNDASSNKTDRSEIISSNSSIESDRRYFAARKRMELNAIDNTNNNNNNRNNNSNVSNNDSNDNAQIVDKNVISTPKRHTILNNGMLSYYIFCFVLFLFLLFVLTKS